MQPTITLLYRPTKQPAVATPFGARSVGHYIWPAGVMEKPIAKPFVQLFWTVSGVGDLAVAGAAERLRIGPGQLGLYLPGDVHAVRSVEGPWEYRWWTLDGPLARQTVTAFGLTHGRVYEPGPAPIPLFEALESAISNVTPDGERRAAALAFELLAWAAGGASPQAEGEDPLVTTTLATIHRYWADPTLNVALLASQADVHRSVLSRRFRRVVGVPPVAYLTGLRIQRALSMLMQTDLPVAEVADRCGFDDPNYFARAIRRATGESPTGFRTR